MPQRNEGDDKAAPVRAAAAGGKAEKLTGGGVLGDQSHVKGYVASGGSYCLSCSKNTPGQ